MKDTKSQALAGNVERDASINAPETETAKPTPRGAAQGSTAGPGTAVDKKTGFHSLICTLRGMLVVTLFQMFWCKRSEGWGLSPWLLPCGELMCATVFDTAALWLAPHVWSKSDNFERLSGKGVVQQNPMKAFTSAPRKSMPMSFMQECLSHTIIREKHQGRVLCKGSF